MRKPHVGFLRDRRADVFLRLGEIASLDGDDAERVARRRDAGVIRERLYERRIPLCRAD